MLLFIIKSNRLFAYFQIVINIKSTFRDKYSTPVNKFMPETENSAATTTQNTEAKVPVSTGKMQTVTMTFPQEGLQNQENTQQQNNGTQNADTNNEGANATSNAATGAATSSAAPAPTEINEELLKSFFEKNGIKYEGLDKLKEKVNYEPSLEPTDEQKKQQELAKEKRRLDKFISGGGTAETYVSLKGIAEADPNKFALDLAKTNLMKEGFTQEDAEKLIKEQFFQIDDAELEQEGDETDKAYKIRMKGLFAKQLTDLSAPIRSQAAGILADLNSAIDSEDLYAQNEVAISAKIDEDFKTMPRKLNIEIGDIGGGQTASPLQFDVSEKILAEVRDELKDPAKRQQLFLNQDGSLNLTKLAQVEVKARSFDSVAKISYLESQTRNNEAWHKVFPSNKPSELGIGGNTRNQNGNNTAKPVSVGKVQRVQPQRQS